jgi:hypothetical protein
MSRKTKSPEITRLQLFMQSMNMKTDELAESLNVPERTLTNYIWTDKPLGGNLLRQLQAVHHLSIDWLLTGNGAMYIQGYGLDQIAANYDDDSLNDHPEALIPYFATTDLTNMADFWWLCAKSAEQSLIQSGAVPGEDYSRLDLYRLAQPFVLERFKEPGLEVTANEII